MFLANKTLKSLVSLFEEKLAEKRRLMRLTMALIKFARIFRRFLTKIGNSKYERLMRKNRNVIQIVAHSKLIGMG